jgi:DNA helicase HerA-like ATPase
VVLLPRFGNRHGLVAGATGTGKTVTLMTVAEGFSRMGVPVFLADVKGDVAGLAIAGTASDKLQARIAEIGIADYRCEANPAVFWDLFGKLGHPVRTTVSEMGPTLLARVLELNDTQAACSTSSSSSPTTAACCCSTWRTCAPCSAWSRQSARTSPPSYGLVSTQSIGAIQRSLLRLEQEGGEMFFGEPGAGLADLMRTTPDGRGVVNILASEQLILKPRLYSSFLLWLLSELFEQLPEVGDLDKPKLVFVFDEAHLLFDDAPPALQQRVEQVVRIIRSKGVGVYFCSQFPDDVPDDILGQLGNRVQHALRAFTPRDQKAVKTRPRRSCPIPGSMSPPAISQLGTGERWCRRCRTRASRCRSKRT